jgi:hypothetical protein
MMRTSEKLSSERHNQDKDASAANTHFRDVLHLLDEEAGKTQLPSQSPAWQLALGIAFQGVLCFAILRYMGGTELWLSLSYGALMGLMLAWSWRQIRQFAIRLRARLPHSGLIELIALGPQELSNIYSYSPWPWSLIILGPRPRDLKGWIRLVARNLDWYLEEPKLLIRAELLTAEAIWVLFFIYMMSRAISVLIWDSPLQAIAAGLAVGFPASVLWGLSYQKRRLGAMLLRDYLRERLTDGDGVPEQERNR